ncbi:MAG TPA: SMC-Scp complex subunit ScpB, partial [Ignavibacteria bacterium]|nr:SMC-Scp complex subunit ScpB [Ignavibacteria bacterium]
MISTEIKNIVESMIFASEEEITSKQIKDIVDKSGLRVSISEIEESVNTLNEEFKINNKPFEILRIAGGYSFATKKEYGRFIGKLFEDKQRKKLSQSALETLSIIAYKQPITRSEIEFIRGVNVDYIVNSLLEKDLITINGRSETPGRPILYGTTKTFLKVLGLNSLDDLPKLKEINEILKNQEIEGITEADIELFNSVNNPENANGIEHGHQLELLTNDEINREENADTENEIEITEENYNENVSIDKDELELNNIIESETEENLNEENILSENILENSTEDEVIDKDEIELDKVIESEKEKENVINSDDNVSESMFENNTDDEVTDNDEIEPNKVIESEIENEKNSNDNFSDVKDK